MTGGTYALVCSVPTASELTVGALGDVRLPPGGYVYAGSALGTGGFARVERHRRVARGEHHVRHWHVDYLTGHPAVTLFAVVAFPGRDAECSLADALAGGPVDGFGASDCECDSHLARYDAVDEALRAVLDARTTL